MVDLGAYPLLPNKAGELPMALLIDGVGKCTKAFQRTTGREVIEHCEDACSRYPMEFAPLRGSDCTSLIQLVVFHDLVSSYDTIFEATEAALNDRTAKGGSLFHLLRSVEMHRMLTSTDSGHNIEDPGPAKLADTGDTALHTVTDPELASGIASNIDVGVNTRNNAGDTPVLHACRHGRWGVALALLSAAGREADPNLAGDDGTTCLPLAMAHVAESRECREVVGKLIRCGAEVKGVRFVDLCNQRLWAAAAAVLDAGHVSARERDDGLEIALRARVEEGSGQNRPGGTLLAAFIRAGADASLLTEGSDVPPLLHFCVGGQYRAAFAMLVTGADANAVDARGRTALAAVVKRCSSHDPSIADQLEPALKLVKKLLAAGADVNKQDAGTGETPLLVGITRKAWGAMSALLHAGADSSIPSKEGRRCLVAFVDQLPDPPKTVGVRLSRSHAEENARMVRRLPRLLSAGADVNAPDGITGETPLLAAIKRQCWEAVDKLLDAGADVSVGENCGSKCLISLAGATYQPHHKVAVARRLLAAGSQVNERDGATGMTPLLSAVSAQDLALVEFLLAEGADIGMRDKEGRSCLCFTFERHMTDTLLAAGANVNDRDPATGKTVLFHAIETPSRFSSPVRWLNRGADPTIGDNAGRHCLPTYLERVGAGRNKKPIPPKVLTWNDDIRMLLRQGASLMIPNPGPDAEPPIASLLASLEPFRDGRKRAMDALSDAPADALRGTTEGGWTCYHWAVDSKLDVAATPPLAAALEASGTDINARDDLGRTALRNAAEGASAKVIRWLMRVGADPHIKDNDGVSAADVAPRRKGGIRSQSAAMKAMGVAMPADGAAKAAPAAGRTAKSGRRARKRTKAAPSTRDGADDEQPRKKQRQQHVARAE